jgi:DNA-binding transcriptional ArsR family regulator
MEKQFNQITALIGDQTRSTIMWTLMDGKAFTATELAIAAETSPQNISMHLTKLLQADLLSVEKQGRHRYYRFSRREIAYAIEGLANLIPPAVRNQHHAVENDVAIKHCRTCYDHLAGVIGVGVTDALLRQHIIIYKGKEMEVSNRGRKWFSDFDIDVDELKSLRRSFLRPCLDWSERRHHIAGSLAAAMLEKMLREDWIRKTRNSRAIVVSGKGEKKMYEYFNLAV